MIALRWDQVNAWRIAQHTLLPRAPRQQMINTVRQVGGIHAQLMSAAELALQVRVDDVPAADIHQALWHDRTLVKTWAMRGTLHLLTASDFPLYVAARKVYAARRPPSYYHYHGITPEELDALLAHIPQILSDTPLTRQELADALAQQTGSPHLRDVLLSGWGALLKPSAFQGDLCFGPNQGQNVTFVRPDAWIGAWQPLDPPQALREIVRRYLTVYGPATTDDFARWWGIQASQARKTFQSLGDELTAVDVEGWPAWGMTAALDQLQTLTPVHSVRLLPQFDVYTVGLSRDCEPLLPQAYKGRVYRPQGWISAVVTVDGRITGTWSHKRQRAKMSVQINMFAPRLASIIAGIQAEAQRIGDLLGTDIAVTYKD